MKHDLMRLALLLLLLLLLLLFLFHKNQSNVRLLVKFFLLLHTWTYVTLMNVTDVHER